MRRLTSLLVGILLLTTAGGTASDFQAKKDKCANEKKAVEAARAATKAAAQAYENAVGEMADAYGREKDYRDAVAIEFKTLQEKSAIEMACRVLLLNCQKEFGEASEECAHVKADYDAAYTNYLYSSHIYDILFRGWEKAKAEREAAKARFRAANAALSALEKALGDALSSLYACLNIRFK